MISARESLALLREGNRRFVADVRSQETFPSRARRLELTSGQEPFATVLGCSDSRVPVEIVFDQGLGDLFVIRVAGNIVAPSLIGSVEFAAEKFCPPPRRGAGTLRLWRDPSDFGTVATPQRESIAQSAFDRRFGAPLS